MADPPVLTSAPPPGQRSILLANGQYQAADAMLDDLREQLDAVTCMEDVIGFYELWQGLRAALNQVEMLGAEIQFSHNQEVADVLDAMLRTWLNEPNNIERVHWLISCMTLSGDVHRLGRALMENPGFSFLGVQPAALAALVEADALILNSIFEQLSNHWLWFMEHPSTSRQLNMHLSDYRLHGVRSLETVVKCARVVRSMRELLPPERRETVTHAPVSFCEALLGMTGIEPPDLSSPPTVR